MIFDMRAEFQAGQFTDLKIPATDLRAARARAREIIDEQTQRTNAFDWRGQVAFVNTSPAEERGNLGPRPALATLFHPRSLRAESR